VHQPRPRATGLCEQCGTSVRQLLDGLCKPCWDRRRYRAQRERLLELNRRWREANPDYWKQPHIYARVRRWHREHPERSREILRAALRRRRARMNGAHLGDAATTDAYAALLRDDPCAYCGEPASDADHIDAISRGGVHSWDNLTAACRACNVSKYSEPLLRFMLRRSAQRPHTGHGEAPSRA
jgi:5-methylcytosine-specific restriction endonuclease McrA